jgi:DedD protein
MQALWEEKLEAADAAEAHWSTGTILAIFFAASLISAVFFGLGYSFGRGGTSKPAIGMMPSSAITADNVISPAASTPATFPERLRPQPASAMAATVAHQSDSMKQTHAAQAQASKMQATHATAVPAKSHTPAHANPSAAESVGATRYMVQVGAIGDRKDALTLVSKLRKRGFHAGIYPSKRDKFLHVQIGPFATTEQAQTVRHHVTASGYHAIVKPRILK